ncbi:MAG: glutaredoxin [Parvularculaceae bacterium]|nr:glutaredoxin [Parvularculaceae bacterium]
MAKRRDPKPVRLRMYKWEGSWGPFTITLPCGECALTEDVIEATLNEELAHVPVEFEVKPWLSYWWEPILHGGWHAPIILVGNKVIAQGDALNRGVLVEQIIRAYSKSHAIEGNKVFGKPNCPYCTKAKELLDEAGIEYDYLDVVENPAAMYEMLVRVKPEIGHLTPVTTPQIWMDGKYVGGADELGQLLDTEVEPDPRRGQGSMSPTRKLKSAGRGREWQGPSTRPA